jgi:hypothetical protein
MAGILDALTPTTIANYARGAWDGVSENNPFFSEWKKRGKINYDVGGDHLEGPLEAGRYQPTISAPGMDLSELFAPKVRHARWSGNWGELANALVLDRGLLRRNSGDQALVNLKKTEIPALFRDTIVGDNGLAYQILQQNATTYTGNGLPFYGLPTFLPGQADIANYDLEGFDPSAGTLTGAVPADTDIEVGIGNAPTYQNYLGLSMKYNNLTTVDAREKDAWTPTLVNTSYTGWTGTNDDEANAVLIFCQYGVDRACRFSNGDTTKRPTFGILDFTTFRYMGAKIAAKQTIYVENQDKTLNSSNLGYGQFQLMHAGLPWFWDENMPTGTQGGGYVVNANFMTLNVQPLYKEQENGSPLTVSGEDAGIMEACINFDPIRRQYLVSATIPAQLICHPRMFVRLGNYS